MRRKFLRTALMPLAACTLIVSGCGGKKTANTTETDVPESQTAEAEAPEGQTPDFTTDSVHWEDSVATGACRAIAKISGQYPSTGNPMLVDSVRRWIGSQISFAGYSDKPVFTATAAELGDGSKLVAAAGNALTAMARKDFAGFEKDSISVNYEFSYNFKPIFESDSLLTYSFAGYVYLGGAHGGSTGLGQTFNRNNGASLTYANSFRADRTDALKDLIRKGLWEQYFQDEASGGSGAATLKEALLIDPDTLPLPVCPPEFGKNGIIVTYQQYEIACYAAGMPSCVLSYDAVKPLLTEQTARLVP